MASTGQAGPVLRQDRTLREVVARHGGELVAEIGEALTGIGRRGAGLVREVGGLRRSVAAQEPSDQFSSRATSSPAIGAGRSVNQWSVRHCGWTSTPRVDEKTALATLAEDHDWTDPKCSRCRRDRTPSGISITDERLLGLHRNLQVEDGGQPGREALLCATDIAGCDEIWDSMVRGINSLDPFAGGRAGEQGATVLPFRRAGRKRT